ncbi:hypothetical protein BgiMline_035589 [Biomphalaria glabrata]|nr:nucleolar protein dao-5 [Biomphalaria glabrata]
MASKRDLYHVASNKLNKPSRTSSAVAVGTKKRKPLAQGRLEMNEINNQPRSTSPQTSPSSLPYTGTESHSDCHLGLDLSVQEVDLKVSDTGLTDEVDPSISPIRSVPKLTEDMPLQPVSLSKCLDLSDSEESESSPPKPVLVCDASHLGVSTSRTEVDVVIGYEPSPVKVVCHTPGKHVAKSSALTSSHKHLVNDSPTQESYLNESLNCSLSSYRESPRRTTDKSGKLAFLKHLSTFSEPQSAESMDYTPSKVGGVVSTSAQSEVDSEPCSLDGKFGDTLATQKESITGKAADIKKMKSKESSIEGQSKLKKGKTTRVVQSRYMQAAVNKTLNLSKNVLGSSKESSGHQKPHNIKSSRSEKQNSQKMATSSQSNVDRKTSTPTFDEKSHYLDDISAIQSASTMSFCLGTTATSHQQELLPVNPPKPSNSKQQPLPKIKAALKPTKSSVSKSKQESTALALDFEYTKYIQWAFLNLKAKRALAEQDAAAKSQLNELWQLLEWQRQELAQSQAEVKHLKRTLLVEEILEKSESALNTAVSSFPLKDYTTLGAALDTTLHQLPVKDIIVPHSDLERQKLDQEMITILSKSKQLLEEIQSVAQMESSKLDHYAENLKTIDSCYAETCSELQDFHQDLNKVQSLTTEMTSLFIQDMQDCEEKIVDI